MAQAAGGQTPMLRTSGMDGGRRRIVGCGQAVVAVRADWPSERSLGRASKAGVGLQAPGEEHKGVLLQVKGQEELRSNLPKV